MSESECRILVPLQMRPAGPEERTTVIPFEEYLAEIQRRYREENKEKIAENQRRYYEENKEKIAEDNARARAKRRAA